MKGKIPDFLSKDHLKRWLVESPVGQSVLHELTAEHCSLCRHDRRPVLVLAHADGWLEISGRVRAHVVRVLDGMDDPIMEAMIEEYHEASFPRWTRTIEPPPVWVGSIKPVSVQDECWRLAGLDLLEIVCDKQASVAVGPSR